MVGAEHRSLQILYSVSSTCALLGVLFLSGWRVQTLGLVSCSMNYLSVVTATLSAQTSFYVGVFHEKDRCIPSGGTMWAGGSV